MPRASLPVFTKLGFEGQVKKDGVCLVVAPEGVLTRHMKEPEDVYDTSQLMFEGATLACEGMKDGRVYVWDLLRFKGERVTDRTWVERQFMLDELDIPPYFRLVSRACDLLKWYDSLNGEDEGLVLRLPTFRWYGKGGIMKCKRG